jgi:hypothetical protein
MIKFVVLIFDDRSFKYNSSLDLSNDTTRRGYFDDNLNFEPCTIGDTQTKKQGSRSFFIEHYRKHSKQLVNALQKWENQLKFTSYEYNYGYKEGLVTPDRIEPEVVPYMKEMKEHLNKAYPHLLPSPLEVETKRKTLCKQMQNMMAYKTDIVPSRPSFEKIIIDRIKKEMSYFKNK